MQEELVSVVLPAFNAERTLDATLSSVRRQTHRRLEIVVVDDGSRDGTADLARRHAAEDERIRVISIPNGGVANARNTGIAATKGPYIATIDSDDLWHPDKIALQMRALLEGGEDVGYVYNLSRRIDEQDRVLGDVKSHPMQGRIYLRSIVFNPVGNGSVILARRSALEGIGGFEADPDVHGAEDNLAQIMMNRTWRVCVAPLHLTGYRVTENSLSSDFSRMARRRFAVLRHVSERFPETPAAVLSLAEGRLRAVLATQAFRRNMIGQGLAELARACRLAPLCALEIAAVDLAARVRGRVRSALGRASSRGARTGADFFACDPASPAKPPPRPLETRRLEALGKIEEEFFRSAGAPQAASNTAPPPASGST
ncbi:glycosyltransferase family 2 protein [Pikeienuella sp. HZG-20]|uniref:glycosyltransferase family 2 protein n=1 Tax=Paludibacillus litoralis TaxID=3133267 RepID=UPI0030EE6738